MSTRELIALGTSSQVPTRDRSHNAYMVRWDGEGFLLDPGEGAQRQLTLAGIGACAIHNILITHFHGDHCLGLAGIIQRLSLDRCDHPVQLYYPETGELYVEHLCSASVYQSKVEIVRHPVKIPAGGEIELIRSDQFVLTARELEHSIPTIGFRIEEPQQRRFLPSRLDEVGVHGKMVGELQRKGSIEVNGRLVRLEDVTTVRSGNVFAFIMDTRPCPAAVELARGADLVLMEGTYTSEHADLAKFYCHSTAADAAKTALDAGARRLALTHFSQRYPDTSRHILDAEKIFANVIALNDLDRVEIHRRASTPER